MKTSSSQTIAPVASLSLFLPSGILDYFTLVNHVSQDTCFILYLEEKATIPAEYSDLHLHSKGFLPEIEVQDFPIRGKAVYLRIKRRRWEDPSTGQTYSRDWSLITLDMAGSMQKIAKTCFPRAMQVIEQEAQKKHARIITVEQSDIARCSGYALRLCGTFQWENAAAAELAARYVLGKHYGGPEYEMQYDKTGPKSEKTNLNDRIKSALEEAVWPGRMEIVSKEPFLLVDGAHNSNGVDALKESLMQMYPGEKFCFFMGVMADKDYDVMIREILPLAEEFYTVTPDSDRALQASHLADFIRKEGVEATELSGVDEIRKHLKRDTKNVAFGSLYFIGELKRHRI